MTVKELITTLQGMDPKLKVVMSNKYGSHPVCEVQEGDYDERTGDWQPIYTGRSVNSVRIDG